MFNARTELHIFHGGKINVQRYRNKLLRPLVRLDGGAVGPEFLFLDDNAHPHRADIMENFLEEEGIRRMEWPTCFQDKNPIKHAWNTLGSPIAALQPPPQTIPNLLVALREEWN